MNENNLSLEPYKNSVVFLFSVHALLNIICCLPGVYCMDCLYLKQYKWIVLHLHYQANDLPDTDEKIIPALRWSLWHSAPQEWIFVVTVQNIHFSNNCVVVLARLELFVILLKSIMILLTSISYVLLSIFVQLWQIFYGTLNFFRWWWWNVHVKNSH